MNIYLENTFNAVNLQTFFLKSQYCRQMRKITTAYQYYVKVSSYTKTDQQKIELIFLVLIEFALHLSTSQSLLALNAQVSIENTFI